MSNNNSLAMIKNYMTSVETKDRLNEMLGKRASAFSNSIVNVVSGNYALQKCDPASVMSAAMKAATFDLPIDPSLGFAAIVPYGGKAGFQLMYKGVTQLCIRSGKYKTINCGEVYSDELKWHNPITGEVEFNDPSTFKERYSENGNVVGHFASFKLLSGFEKSDYMTHIEGMAHGKKYSKAYQYDLNKNKSSSCWTTDPNAMCNKTVLLRLLTKYGIMSIDMQDALISDSDRPDFSQAQKDNDTKIKDESGSDIIEADVIPFGEDDSEKKDAPADDVDWRGEE